MGTCSGCGAAAPAEAKFCGVCGKPQVAMAGGQAAPAPPMPQPAPMPPPMPVMPQMARGFSGGGGQSRQINLNGAAQEAFASATRAIGAAGGDLLWQQPPQGAKFLLTRKGVWSTAGVAIKYDGDLQVAPSAAGQATARITLKLQWGSAVPLLLMQAGSVLLAAMFNYYIAAFALIIIAITLGYTAWNVSSGLPDKALNEIATALQNGAPAFAAAPHAQPVTPPAYSPAPPPAPTPQPSQQAPAAPSAAPAGDLNAVTQQIMQLAALRDAGAITVEEFEAKKKELLSRI